MEKLNNSTQQALPLRRNHTVINYRKIKTDETRTHAHQPTVRVGSPEPALVAVNGYNWRHGSYVPELFYPTPHPISRNQTRASFTKYGGDAAPRLSESRLMEINNNSVSESKKTHKNYINNNFRYICRAPTSADTDTELPHIPHRYSGKAFKDSNMDNDRRKKLKLQRDWNQGLTEQRMWRSNTFTDRSDTRTSKYYANFKAVQENNGSSHLTPGWQFCDSSKAKRITEWLTNVREAQTKGGGLCSLTEDDGITAPSDTADS